MLPFLLMLFMTACLAVYFLPTIVAMIADHKYLPSIALLNLFLGWTLVGWAGALIWSVTGQKD